MTDYVASISGGIKLKTPPNRTARRSQSLPNNPHLRKFCYEGQRSFWSPGLKLKMCGVGVPELRSTLSPASKRAVLQCNCSLVNPEVAAVSNWIGVVDQVLLTASILLTYMAGVVPLKRFYRKDLSAEKSIPASCTSPGSSARIEEQAHPGYAFDVVKRKLLDSLDAFECGANVGKKILGFNDRRGMKPLHLSALADGPRLRLLWDTFQKIEEEVNSISNSGSPDMYDRVTIFSSVIQKSCQPVCMTWLEREHGLANSNVDSALVSLLRARLIGDSSILLNIKNSGKEDLYADLLWFLCFGSIREGCYDKSLFISNGVSILEDFLINLADGMASQYLELISVDSNVSNETYSLSLELCTLTTRALQKLRNEVALNQWLYQNMESVASMYEDRFDLCTLQRQLVDELANGHQESSWWKVLISRTKSVTASPSLHYVVISQFSMPVKRTKELSALTGWRYYFSLFLELSDIAMPLIRAVISKVSDAISFFLVRLIGQSLGLIYTGIRQSLRWK